MSQRIGHLYKLVTFPAFYQGFQSATGAEKARKRFVAKVLQVEPGMKVLDVGCGPASILPYLPEVDYTGIDVNEKHIEFAQAQFPGRGRFLVGNVVQSVEAETASFDRVMVVGVLHHLSDDECKTLFRSLSTLVAPEGQIATIDPVRLPRQRLLPRLMNHFDSGLNIRTAAEYMALAKTVGFHSHGQVFGDFLRIPYDHFCMTLRRTPN